MRILHTSDWHLGATLYGASREEEHRRFFTWLTQTAAAHEVDAIIVAGDIFEHAQASAEAHRLYYEALHMLGNVPSVSQLVVVAGNHDSGARLEAPRAVLDGIGVHVVGVWGDTDDHLILIGPKDAPVAVVAAVPYVHEYRLGLRTIGRSEVEVRADLETRFRALYDGLASEADRRFHGLPLIGTGHLTLRGSVAGEGRSQIHMSRVIEGLSPSLFNDAYAYVALGHIHEARDLDKDRVTYCGSPIPVGRSEAHTQRYVHLVELDRGTREVTRLEVPLSRQIIELRGTDEEVREAIPRLRWRSPLAPFLYITVEVEFFRSDLASAYAAIVDAAHPDTGLRLLRVEQLSTGESKDVARHTLLETPLGELRPEEVFSRLYQLRFDSEPPEAIASRFATLLSGRGGDV